MNISRKDLRKFGVTAAVAIGLMFGIVFPLLAGKIIPLWPFIVAAVLLLFALLLPSVLLPLHVVMHAIGTRFIALINWLVLGIFYYLFLAPYSALLRALGKVGIEKKPRDDLASYRIVPENRKKTNLERPF